MFKLFDYVKIVGGFAKGYKGHIVDYSFDHDSNTAKFKVRVYEMRQGFSTEIFISAEHLLTLTEQSEENL